MKQVIYTLFLIVTGLSTYSQYTVEKKHYVVQADSSEVEGSSLLYRKSRDGALFLMDYSIPVLADSVIKFKNFHGTFVQVPKKKKVREYALRIRKGNVSLFERVNMRLYSDPDLNIPSDKGVNPTARGLATGRKFHYYAAEDGVVKKSTVKNLRLDMASHAPSWNYMKRYRKNQWLQFGMISCGTAAASYSMLAATGQGVFSPISLLGVILTASSMLLESTKKDLKWMAVESYNYRR